MDRARPADALRRAIDSMAEQETKRVERAERRANRRRMKPEGVPIHSGRGEPREVFTYELVDAKRNSLTVVKHAGAPIGYIARVGTRWRGIGRPARRRRTLARRLLRSTEWGES